MLFLFFLVPPIAEVIPATSSFAFGETREIECIAKGFPEPKINWLRANQIMIANEKVRVAGNKLSIFNMQQGDEGEYTCVATNPAGENRAVATLNFVGKFYLAS
jgi:hypothetical protein